VGVPVSREEFRSGDLIFYYSPVSHVAMNLGNRNGVPSIVHAANPSAG
jgi:peptidoglycan DL-endopeptidase CwlO